MINNDLELFGAQPPEQVVPASYGSPGLYKPVNAFGVVWTAQKLQSKLGYATSPNETGGSGTLQAFENGSILSVGSDVYVLLKNGTWQPFSG